MIAVFRFEKKYFDEQGRRHRMKDGGCLRGISSGLIYANGSRNVEFDVGTSGLCPIEEAGRRLEPPHWRCNGDHGAALSKQPSDA